MHLNDKSLPVTGELLNGSAHPAEREIRRKETELLPPGKRGAKRERLQ